VVGGRGLLLAEALSACRLVLVEVVGRDHGCEQGEDDEEGRDHDPAPEHPFGDPPGLPDRSEDTVAAHQYLTLGSTHALTRSIKMLTKTTSRAKNVMIPWIAM
jgi:hypothetical protein